MSYWIPRDLFPLTVSVVIAATLTMLWLAVAVVAVGGLVQFVMRQRWTALAEPRLWLALTLLGCVMVWGASQINRNVYEAAHVMPILVIFALFCFCLPVAARWRERALLMLVNAAVPLALLSQAAVLTIVVPHLVKAARTPGYLPLQQFSLSTFGYSLIRRDIARAMAISGMPADRRLNRLLVDDLTYLALQHSYLPLHRLGVLSAWNGSIDDPVRYLISRNSDGAVIGCHYLPADMRQASARSGQICALSRAGLERLAASKAPQ